MRSLFFFFFRVTEERLGAAFCPRCCPPEGDAGRGGKNVTELRDLNGGEEEKKRLLSPNRLLVDGER